MPVLPVFASTSVIVPQVEFDDLEKMHLDYEAVAVVGPTVDISGSFFNGLIWEIILKLPCCLDLDGKTHGDHG